MKGPHGFTLIETIAVLVLLMLVAGTFGVTLVRQQQFYRGAGELIQARQGVRDASELMSADLRAISLEDTVRVMADSAVEFYSTIATSVLCAALGDFEIGLPATGPPRGNTLTSFATEPDTGDLALVFRDTGDSLTGSRWDRYRIASFSMRADGAACPAASPFAVPVPGAFSLALRTPLRAEPRAGTPIRFLRRSRYSLYRSSDGLWYLGYRRCGAVAGATCGAIQPLSGPYRPYSSDPAATGILFQYFNSSGSPLSLGNSSASLARVSVTARALSAQRLRSGNAVQTFGDSSFVTVSIRNRTP